MVEEQAQVFVDSLLEQELVQDMVEEQEKGMVQDMVAEQEYK
jgi:hypothetical protein